MKRARNTTHLACNGTLEILYTGSSDYVVRQVGEGGRTHEDFEDGITTDSVDLIVHFRPPLTAATSVETTLSIQYVGGKHVETPIIWRQTLQPLDKGASLILREEELEYRCYPSYNVHVKGGKILALYVSVENAMTAPTTTFDLTLQVHLMWTLHNGVFDWTPDIFRKKHLYGSNCAGTSVGVRHILC
jgi:hypothetical protein